MRKTTSLLALVLALGSGLAQPVVAQEDPLSRFLRALAADLDRAASQGFGPHSDDRDDDDDDGGRSGGRDDDDDGGGSDDDDDDSDDDNDD